MRLSYIERRKKRRHDMTWCMVLVLLLCALVVAMAAESNVCTSKDANDCQDSTTSTNTAKDNVHEAKAWFDDASKDGLKFLKDNVFGQKPPKKQKGDKKDKKAPPLQRANSFSGFFQKESGEGEATGGDAQDTKKQKKSKKDDGILTSLADVAASDDPAGAFLELLLNKSVENYEEEYAPSFEDTAQLFINHAKEVLDQVQRVLGNRLDKLMEECFYLPSMWYFLRQEQYDKNAYWKANKHKFMPKVSDVTFFKELHQALYLSDLAYVDTEQQVRDGLARVDHGGWELLFVDTEGNPAEPAHFVAVEKQAAPLEKKKKKKENFWNKPMPWGEQEEELLKVMIVVRGTKSLGDVLSDGLLEATDFKGKYKAHGGIQKSGSYIVNKHIERLKLLLEVSGRSKIQLLLFGHSLGCGTAAIAAMEFHDNHQDVIQVQSVGFGCPSLVSPELSEQYKDIITTVVADADVVPRMSGSSIVNLHLEMMSFDWTGYMQEELYDLGQDILKDVNEWTSGMGTKFAKEVLTKLGEKIENFMAKQIRPNIKKAVEEGIPRTIGNLNDSIRNAKEQYRVQTELIPPGTCLHLYRTATGFEAAYTPCSFFEEIEWVPHLVDDHMTKTGYHNALLSLLRQQLQDYNAKFENELFEMPKPEKDALSDSISW